MVQIIMDWGLHKPVPLDRPQKSSIMSLRQFTPVFFVR